MPSTLDDVDIILIKLIVMKLDDLVKSVLVGLDGPTPLTGVRQPRDVVMQGFLNANPKLALDMRKG